MFFRKYLHSAANFGQFSRESPHDNLNAKVTLLLLLTFLDLQTVGMKYFVFFFLHRVSWFYNVSISCHLTVKARQIISDLLAVCLNELETSLLYNS